jgi:hypothetical protein
VVDLTTVNHVSTETPDQRIHRTLSIVLLGDHKIQINDNSSVLSAFVLGEPDAPYNSNVKQDVVTRARINDGVLIVGVFFETFLAITTIKTYGRNTCSATRKYKLNPGQQFFITPNSKPGITEKHAENISCTIKQ